MLTAMFGTGFRRETVFFAFMVFFMLTVSSDSGKLLLGLVCLPGEIF